MTPARFNNTELDLDSRFKDNSNILKEMDINNNQHAYLNDQTEQIVEQTSQTGKNQMKLMSKEKKKPEEVEQMKQGNQDGSEESLKPPSKRRKRAPVSTTRVTRSNGKTSK
jgi:hypothetical protein